MLEEQYGVQLCLFKIRRRLQVAGLNCCVSVRTPLVKVVNKMKRLLWAEKHRNWTPEQWKECCGLMRKSLSFSTLKECCEKSMPIMCLNFSMTNFISITSIFFFF
jgi:hypothetical protein